jgi:hypothetical protein
MTVYKFSPRDPASISLNQVTTGTGEPKAFNDCRQVNWLIQGEGTINGGTVIIECAHASDYSGTWKELETVDATLVDGNKLEGNTFPMVPGGFVRGRIGSNITGGGTITVRLNGLLG